MTLSQVQVLPGPHRNLSTWYLPIAWYEAERAERLLGEANGLAMAVRPILIILTETVIPQVTVKEMPEDVLVLARTDVPDVLKRAPTRISAQQVDALYSHRVARRRGPVPRQTLGQEHSPAGMRGRPRGRNLPPGRTVPKGTDVAYALPADGYPDDRSAVVTIRVGNREWRVPCSAGRSAAGHR